MYLQCVASRRHVLLDGIRLYWGLMCLYGSAYASRILSAVQCIFEF